MNQEQKIAIVTGASRGLGKAIAATLGQIGLTVIGTATTEKGATAISQYLQECKCQGSGKKLHLVEDDINAFVADIQKSIGAPTILINNAGITRDNLLLRMNDQEWDDIINTNLTAIFKLSKACLKPMMKTRWGRIVNISSVVGLTGNPGQTNYAAAKAGVIGFSKSLAREIGKRNITVNIVAPGFIKTDMTDALSDKQRDELLRQIPLVRLGQPADIAQTVAFLVSDAANYITGQTLHVNGGMYMN